MDRVLRQKMQEISLSLFRKDFFGIYHGSISAKIGSGSFYINKRDTIFDEFNDDSMIKVNMHNKDYSWNEASIDAGIHEEIYNNVSSAKYICYSMPQYTTAYSLHNDTILPKDYFGYSQLGEVAVYDPKSFSSWYERAPFEISNFFVNNNIKLMVVRGYGVYSYDRDIHALVKNIAILEKSCRLLNLSEQG
ncbi:MAG: class II aldolase and adducin N-terminal domain-containing protein [Campylobacterota bacterium]